VKKKTLETLSFFHKNEEKLESGSPSIYLTWTHSSELESTLFEIILPWFSDDSSEFVD
jgi:hypothetical protein